MPKIIYVSASQFSGTTLLSFLLNRHSEIATVGHTMGWPFEDPDAFLCSCGARIADCPLFRHIADSYTRSGLQFRPNNFGTAFAVSENGALNYYLTEAFPRISSTRLETIIDKLVRSIRSFREKLDRQTLANRVFMDAVLDYWGASYYLDNSHSPFRLRRLATDDTFDVYNLHLVRDPRGVTMSLMRNSGMSAENAVNIWVKRQLDILRISREVTNTSQFFYEELCTLPDQTLRKIYRFAGLDPQDYNGNFKDSEHHILGNRMRLSDGAIRLDERWKREMTATDRSEIERSLKENANRKEDSRLAMIVDYYLSESYLRGA